MSLVRRAALAAGFGALAGPLLVVRPALAVGIATLCSPPSRVDTAQVATRDLAALPQRRTTPRYVARHVLPRLHRQGRIPVHVHVVTGRRAGERRGASDVRIRQAIRRLNRAMAGRESRLSTPTPFRFRLASIDRTRREGWYHAFLDGPRDRRMKRALHRGGAGALNVYLNAGGTRRRPVLGWSRFPWQYAAAPRLDGVSVHLDALPGGRATGYDRGDTLVHETGHWLGLLHPFEGGCAGSGDLVADTAPAVLPTYTCPAMPSRDAAPLNFMDYAPDACMSVFTRGQVRRMESAWVQFRQTSPQIARSHARP